MTLNLTGQSWASMEHEHSVLRRQNRESGHIWGQGTLPGDPRAFFRLPGHPRDHIGGHSILTGDRMSWYWLTEGVLTEHWWGLKSQVLAIFSETKLPDRICRAIRGKLAGQQRIARWATRLMPQVALSYWIKSCTKNLYYCQEAQKRKRIEFAKHNFEKLETKHQLETNNPW